MVIKKPDISIDIFLKITNNEERTAYEIIEEHIKIEEENPNRYTWWGNNQPFSPNKLEEFKELGHEPKGLIVIPKTSGGTGNIEFIADVLDSVKYVNKGIHSDVWRPNYYFETPQKVFLKLRNFRRVESSSIYNINNYFILSNNTRLADKLHTQYACGYVYRKINKNKNNYGEQINNDTQMIRGFLEGKRKTIQHITIERNAELIREAKRMFKRNNGRLFCEVCKLDFVDMYGELGEDFIEGHHKVPISQLINEIELTINDIALLCSNCHSMVHRKKECLPVEELKQIVNEHRTHR